tara:strand:+ start:65 stop:1507 length:1443 start_codon:yes stop_codon:yes gene_type:complete
MASETAMFESAQALFCAIADLVGKGNLDKVLNLDTYPSYREFSNIPANQKLITKAAAHIDVDVDFKTIEGFLNKTASWYISSVNIAKKLLQALHKEVDPDFKDILAPGFQRNYVRGDKEVMGNIAELYGIANKNTEYNMKVMKMPKFGDVNKWNPADIYYANKVSKAAIKQELKDAKENKSYGFNKLSPFVNDLLKSGDLLPLSLKKQTGAVTISKVNFKPSVKEALIEGVAKKGSVIEGGLWHVGDQKGNSGWDSWKPHPKIIRDDSRWDKDKDHEDNFGKFGEPESKEALDTATTRDLKIMVSKKQDRGSKVGHIQMRHEVSAKKGSWKVDFSYSGGEARGGSVVSPTLFADILRFVDPDIADKFLTAYNKAVDNYATRHAELALIRDKITDKWKTAKTKKNKTLFLGKVSPYDSLRGEASARTVTNKVMPILQKWLRTESKVKTKGGKPNKVDEFIRILFRYVTSRSEPSSMFVIAK